MREQNLEARDAPALTVMEHTAEQLQLDLLYSLSGQRIGHIVGNSMMPLWHQLEGRKRNGALGTLISSTSPGRLALHALARAMTWAVPQIIRVRGR